MAIKSKILVRAGFNPLLKYSPIDFMTKNIVGHNIGNLIYAYSVMNILWTEQVTIEQIYDKNYYSDDEASFINANYDVFVIPFADAFRYQFIPCLKAYTSLIKRLKIPVIVCGVGIRTSYEPKFDINPELNQVVKDFVAVVLDHSTKLGLRGEITGSYLKFLGFKEERDYVPIGCPSLYMYGNNIHLRDMSALQNLKNGKLLFNSNIWGKNLLGEYSPYIDNFIRSFVDFIPNHFLIQQTVQELKYLYLGKIYSRKIHLESIFSEEEFQMMHKLNRVICFTDVPSWINFCSDADLCVGNRFHGTVASILSGTPHIFIPIDGRTRELSDFHHFTAVPFQNLRSNTKIDDYLSNLDFFSFEKYHDYNFRHFIDFIYSNGLNHIFENKSSYIFGESPMERVIKYNPEPIACMDSLSLLGKIKRITLCLPFFMERIKTHLH